MDELDQFPDGVIICEESVAALISDRWSLQRGNIYSQVFLIAVGRGPKNARMVESLGAAGAIASGRYRVWRTERGDDPGGGVFGRKDVAVDMGAMWASPGLWETDRYCLMWHDTYPSLPELLSAYLLTYQRKVLKLFEGKGQ
ncbi:hypothetical protein ACFXP1_07140 [Streptomyces sp. NPDC059112]|uniref:hypothetical protein n=1 Tax=Streptomyces sp. NPDC059112 TaxID=3346730 RepID=UPI0036CA0EBB